MFKLNAPNDYLRLLAIKFAIAYYFEDPIREYFSLTLTFAIAYYTKYMTEMSDFWWIHALNVPTTIVIETAHALYQIYNDRSAIRQD